MAKIDTSGWKEFKLTDIFRMNNTKSIVQKDVVPDSGTVPYVTAQAGNNGVMTYIDCPAEWLDKGDCIMIGGKTLTFSYQAQAFCSNDSHNIALHLKDAEKASEMRYLFLIAALRGSLYQKYSWGDSISMKTIKNDVFQLPVDASGEPDWAYMDEYMSTVMRESEASLESLRQADGEKHALSVSGWREFIIGDLFEKLQLDVKKEDFNKTFDVSEERTGEFNLPLVNAKHGNNGIMYYGREADFETAEMTIDIVQNGAIATGDVYAQPQRTGVLWDAYLVKPKAKIDSAFTLMFLATVLEKAIKDKFSYDDKCVWDKAKLLTVTLPCTSDNEPDWAYMDEYMRTIMKSAASDLSAIQSIG